jgi:hypothetical protein
MAYEVMFATDTTGPNERLTDLSVCGGLKRLNWIFPLKNTKSDVLFAIWSKSATVPSYPILHSLTMYIFYIFPPRNRVTVWLCHAVPVGWLGTGNGSEWCTDCDLDLGCSCCRDFHHADVVDFLLRDSVGTVHIGELRLWPASIRRSIK